MAVESYNVTVLKHGTTHYYVTSNSDSLSHPGRIQIIQNELIKHEVTGYTVDITFDMMREWAINAGVSASEFSKEIKDALLGENGHSFELRQTSGVTPFADLLFWSSKDSSDRKRLGTVKLFPISISEALATLSNTALKAIEDAKKKSVTVDSKHVDLSVNHNQLELTLKTVLVEKHKMEDHMYRAFGKCINIKKERIKALERMVNSRNRTQSHVYVDDSDRDPAGSPNHYDVDTDVDEGDDLISTVALVSPGTLLECPSDPARPPSPAALILVESDDDKTDFECSQEIDLVRQHTASEPVSVKRKLQSSPNWKSDEESDVDVQPDSPSILGDHEAVPSIPYKKRNRLRVMVESK